MAIFRQLQKPISRLSLRVLPGQQKPTKTTSYSTGLDQEKKIKKVRTLQLILDTAYDCTLLNSFVNFCQNTCLGILNFELSVSVLLSISCVVLSVYMDIYFLIVNYSEGCYRFR